MGKRRKPPPRVVPQRSRNNSKRRLSLVLPSETKRQSLAASAKYDPYSKHKFSPAAYGLTPYAGGDEERTYCDAHAKFGKEDFVRIPKLLQRGIFLGLWSEPASGGIPLILWTIDDNGWIYEMRVTNVEQALYHGYPVLTGDAFANHILARAREVAFDLQEPHIQSDPSIKVAISAAERFYR